MVLGVISIGTGIFAGAAGIVAVASHDRATARAALTTCGVAIALGLALWVGGSWLSSRSVDWRTLLFMVVIPFCVLLVSIGGWLVLYTVVGVTLVGGRGTGVIVLLGAGLALIGVGYRVFKAIARVVKG
jgi:hypothetical protein